MLKNGFRGTDSVGVNSLKVIDKKGNIGTFSNL